LSVVASKTSNAVVITNNIGEFEWVNEGFTKLFGYEIDELTRKFGKNIVSTPFQPLVEEKIRLCNETKKTVEYLALNTTKKGDKLWMHSSMTPILDENCEVSKLIIIEANINDLKVAEENIKRQKEEIVKQNQELEIYRTQLENLVENRTKQLLIEKERAVESEKLKSAFIANMSHEIRTPMNAVIGFSNLLTLNDSTPETTFEYIKIINSNAKTLLQLIDDIIDLSRIEAGKLMIKKTECDINTLLDELFLVYNEKIKRENSNIVLMLNKQFKTQKLIVYTDRLRVNQVLINLLDNATKFTSEGIIEFGYAIKDESTVQFFVTDTGIGIEAENQKIIFERFLKIEDNPKKLYRGVGLGLSICKSIISDLQGEIWVESAMGKGSKFYFTLPYIKKTSIN
jgi:PAS domain S-box-containing protein